MSEAERFGLAGCESEICRRNGITQGKERTGKTLAYTAVTDHLRVVIGQSLPSDNFRRVIQTFVAGSPSKW